MAPQLPPKIPPYMIQNWSLFPVEHNYINETGGGLLPPPTLPHMAAAPTSTATTYQHNIPNPNLSWVDEFLGFTSIRRGHHRRSVSDGVTLIETAGSFDQFGDHDCQHDHNSFDRLDDDQLLSMFTDDMSLVMPPVLTSNTAMSSPLSTPSEQNINNEDQVKPCQLSDNLLHLQEAMQQPQSLGGGEVDGSNKLSMESLGLQSFTDGSCKSDPKRVKRILANRQSAQRSRVRKLQYISELERTVTQLQSEVSTLSPRVAFLDHQRLLLNVDNSALKQRIAALAQDKLFKDAHQEALKREIERLRQIYLQQITLNNKNNNNNGDHQNIIEEEECNTAAMPLLSQLNQQRIAIQLSTPDMAITCNDK